MPEWADATFVLVGTLAAFFAYRWGAATESEEHREAVSRAGRLMTSGGLAASSAGMGTIAADGTAPTATLLLFGAAGIALTCGFTLRIGARVASRRTGRRPPGRPLVERYGKTLLAMTLSTALSFFATDAFDSGAEPSRPAAPSRSGADSD